MYYLAVGQQLSLPLLIFSCLTQHQNVFVLSHRELT